jgi:HD-like signal output (HDOD) protein
MERELLGADHAALGGYLLGLWGLPHALVEAVTFHHDEERLTRGGVDLVEAVGAADLLAHAAAGDGPVTERAGAVLDRMVSRHRSNLRELAVEERKALEGEAGGRP